jgi:hypothetical protein
MMINAEQDNAVNTPNKLFTKEFESIDINLVVESLLKKGYFSFPNALTESAVDAIESAATASRVNLNKNEICGVCAEDQYYLTNLLAVSKKFYDLATSNLVMEICKKYLGHEFRLKALRYYETYGGHHMQWHTDNKTDRGFADIPGIIFILYISDVEDGQFQYVEGSHLWSGEKAYSDYSDEFIEENYKEKIKDFKYPSGSLIVYNTYGIHRAKPVFNKSFTRKSVFFQVDINSQDAEPIILNAKFLSYLSDDIKMFLGFGKPSNYKSFPTTSLNTLPLDKNITRLLFRYISIRTIRKIYNSLPKKVRNTIRLFIEKNVRTTLPLR